MRAYRLYIIDPFNSAIAGTRQFAAPNDATAIWISEGFQAQPSHGAVDWPMQNPLVGTDWRITAGNSSQHALHAQPNNPGSLASTNGRRASRRSSVNSSPNFRVKPDPPASRPKVIRVPRQLVPLLAASGSGP